eukprot:TRINITY_DN1700_c0_g2_i4.p2 TRINITY_DN1700_c0_g2~~TRINITY_DN1700_c0_g2_i4.p2  ORF type:complete len:163 (-),score=25.28 TRINITY_DN1700_c0_g2_i4:90-578(-)
MSSKDTPILPRLVLMLVVVCSTARLLGLVCPSFISSTTNTWKIKNTYFFLVYRILRASIVGITKEELASVSSLRLIRPNVLDQTLQNLIEEKLVVAQENQDTIVYRALGESRNQIKSSSQRTLPRVASRETQNESSDPSTRKWKNRMVRRVDGFTSLADEEF